MMKLWLFQSVVAMLLGFLPGLAYQETPAADCARLLPIEETNQHIIDPNSTTIVLQWNECEDAASPTGYAPSYFVNAYTRDGRQLIVHNARPCGEFYCVDPAEMQNRRIWLSITAQPAMTFTAQPTRGFLDYRPMETLSVWILPNYVDGPGNEWVESSFDSLIWPNRARVYPDWLRARVDWQEDPDAYYEIELYTPPAFSPDGELIEPTLINRWVTQAPIYLNHSDFLASSGEFYDKDLYLLSVKEAFGASTGSTIGYSLRTVSWPSGPSLTIARLQSWWGLLTDSRD